MLTMLLLASASKAQSDASIESRESHMSPHLWRGIYDASTSGYFKVDTIGLGALPLEAEYRGIIVEAVSWKDPKGEHALFLTQTGDFISTDSTGYEQERAELHVHHWLREEKSKQWRRAWRISDHNLCANLDQYVGFMDRSLSITDLDADGEAEITVVYELSCSGDIGPGELKVIMYEGNKKCGIRGAAALCHPESNHLLEPSKPSADNAAKAEPTFLAFLIDRWKKFECPPPKQFY